jgi:serine/threonine-protein kinase
VARDPFQLVGTTIDGKYRIDRVLGEGGCGVVYLAWHALLGQPVALKCLKPMGGAVDDEKQLTELFLREARVLFSLGHPNIVRLYDVGTIATSMYAVPYVVLEYIDGPTLDEEIGRRARPGGPGPLSAVELLAIFTPVLEAVSYAHAAGIAHRDLKPSNVMLVRTAHGGSAGVTAKVVDFGIARRLGDPKHSTTATGFTPRYAAPEQWDGASFGPVSTATDVFALGLMIAEACTLRPVLEAAGPAAILASLVDPGRRVRVSDRRPDLPPALDVVVERATRLQASERYRTANELLDALRSALDPRSPRPFVEAPTEHVAQGPRFISAPPPGFSSAPPMTGPGSGASRAPLPLAMQASPASLASTGSPASITIPTAPGSSRGVVAALAAVAFALVALAGVVAWVFVARSGATVASASPTAASGGGDEKDPTKEPVSSPKKPKPAPTTKSADDEFDELVNDQLREALKPQTAPTTRKRPAKDGPSIEISRVMGGQAPNNEEKILSVLDANLKDVKVCYTKALTRDPMLQGEITLMISLDAKGAVSGALCAQDGKSITDAPLRTCVSSKATAWRFAKPKDAAEGFMVTLDFSP